MPKQNKKTSRFKRLFTPTRLLIGYSVLASTVALYFIFSFWPTYQWHTKFEAEHDFSNMMRNSRLAMIDEPAIIPTDDKAYLHEANISLPLTDMATNILYDYNDDVSAYLTLYSKPAIYEPSRKLGEPLCMQLAQVSFDKEDQWGEGFPLEATVKLVDGRTMYIHVNRTDDCRGANVRQGVDADVALGLLRRAESY